MSFSRAAVFTARAAGLAATAVIAVGLPLFGANASADPTPNPVPAPPPSPTATTNGHDWIG